MPTLDFKGKSFIYTHHLGVPYRELVVVPEKSEPAGGAAGLDGNLIVHGDNLEALKALLPRYAGKVDCIYIDPPYNTGTEGWCYNDAVNAPLMREWLKKNANPVDRESPLRHDKWLCMMWPRLQLLKELLAEDGAIFVSIDDNEVHRLRAMMDEVFGEESFVANIVWRRTVSRGVSGEGVLVAHDHILFYRKSDELAVLRSGEAIEEDYSNPDDDPRGPYKLQKLERTLEGARPTMTFAIETPKGPIIPGLGRCDLKRIRHCSMTSASLSARSLACPTTNSSSQSSKERYQILGGMDAAVTTKTLRVNSRR